MAYYSFQDPVFQSAVLPYFVAFPEKEHYRFTLLTFEQSRFQLTPQRALEVERELLTHNIEWHRTTWNSGRFKFLKKLFDFVRGICFAAYLIFRNRCSVVYSEAFPGAVLGHYLCKLTGCHHIVHSFEPHTDYMVEGGVWRADAWEARLLRFHEYAIAMQASVILTGTQKNIEQWRALGSKAKFERGPSCVDINVFTFDPRARESIRNRLEIKESEKLLVYLGKFGGMYWDKELFQLFAACYRLSPSSYRFLVLSQDEHAAIKKGMLEEKIPEGRFHIQSITKDEVPGFLSACDMGICAVRQYASKRFCSPIKDGEYWAVGLPVVIPVGVSDDFEFTARHDLGVVVDHITPAGFERAAYQIQEWFEKHSTEQVRERTRKFAEQDRSAERYRAVLHEIFASLT